jgi:hypothetical protein
VDLLPFARGVKALPAFQEAIAALRTRAELARRLSNETRQPAAKSSLLEIASMLDAEADQLERSAGEQPKPEIGR